MTREERRKAIETAVAEAMHNYLVPASVKVGIAAMAEELRALNERLIRVERSTGNSPREGS